MKLFKETTSDWSTPTKNHIYLLSDNKQWVYGIVRAGTRDLEVFKNRMQFNTRYRTFKQIRSKDEIY